MKATNRIWVGGCAGAVALLVAGGFFLGVQPQLAHAEQTATNAAGVEAQASSTQVRIAGLAKVAAKQSDLQSKAAVLDKSVPSTLQANTFIRRVNTVAALDAVEVQSVTVGSATAYTRPESLAAPVVTADPTAVPTPSATASAAPTATTPSSPVLALADPAITGANLTVIPMTVVVTGTGDAGLQFIKDLQRDERLFLIQDFNTAVDPTDASKVTTTLIGSVYAVKD